MTSTQTATHDTVDRDPSSGAGEILDAARGSGPTLSLLVCTLGRREPLIRLFTSLLAQTRRDFEIVLVDQNPAGSLETLVAPFRDRLSITHVRSAPGLSRARNVGLKRCSAPVVAFPDDDCWYPEDLVSRVVEVFASTPGLAALTGRTVDADGRESLGSYLRSDARIDNRNVWSIGNSNSLFVRRDAARAVAGFDEGLGVGSATPFRSGEETDFLLRVLATGREARYRRDLLIHHDQVADMDPATLTRRAADYSRGFGRVLRLHRYGIGYVAFRLCRTLGGACLAAARRDAAVMRYKAAWAWGTACGYADRAPPTLHGPEADTTSTSGTGARRLAGSPRA